MDVHNVGGRLQLVAGDGDRDSAVQIACHPHSGGSARGAGKGKMKPWAAYVALVTLPKWLPEITHLAPAVTEAPRRRGVPDRSPTIRHR